MGRTVDPPLDAAGQRQAADLAEHLTPWGTLEIRTSPRRRTRDTAQALAHASGAPILCAEPLDELDFGAWSGCSFRELADDPAWTRWNAQRAEARTPAGDTMRGAQRRIVSYIGEIAQQFPQGTVALVTHAEIIRAALLHYLGWSLDEYGRLPIDPASASTVCFTAGAAAVGRINERAPRRECLD
jgi:broad specificity phosphatase PhoE